MIISARFLFLIWFIYIHKCECYFICYSGYIFLHIVIQDLLENLSEEEFVCHREALAAQRLEKPKRLNALTARFWSEITSHQYNFDRTQIEVAYLRTLTKDDVIKFFTVSINYHSVLVWLYSKCFTLWIKGGDSGKCCEKYNVLLKFNKLFKI